MRLIDADALLETSDVFIVHTKEYGSIEVISVDAVGDAPTIDAVPVVRCQECVLHGDCFTENAFLLVGIENPFCCVGKRKEGADNG